ncbi:MAG: neutral/alkaline non-lysosomal ceramidase N-terminal domain-containing protein [Bacteroidales bacterium]|nr:neutral/alkaline non-lysosomal ceramidase N-terminal domain-containing protein [Candidatus Latescibacterota bacterium]
MTRQSRTAILILIIFVLSGCAGISGRLPAPLAPEPTGEFLAGASRVDITPMPGYPMGGYAVAGYISRGVWMRLHARAVCFEDPDGRCLAMVSTDLWAMPAGLADRVAELVSCEFGIGRLAREQIILAATHTHNGPGNYSSSKLYNQMASPEGGFDRDLFDFLAYRIAVSIAAAWEKRGPAMLKYAEAPVPGVARNRSIGPFLANGEDALALIEENRDLPIRRTPYPVGGDDAYRALDQTMRVIRVESVGSSLSPLAVLVFYAVHPTVMNTPTEVYNSDIFGIASAKVERSLEKAAGSSVRPVVAIFNGPEGDIAANWTRRDREDAIEVGSILASGIMNLVDDPGEEMTGEIDFNFGHTKLSDLAGPLSGASTLCGAEADWAFFRDAGFYEGMTQLDPEKQIKGQGVKRHPLEDDVKSNTLKTMYPWIVETVLDPPESVPLGVYRIGPVVIGTLPGEFTTILGRRIRRGISSELPDAKHVLLVGMANEYLSYFTTEEEYAHQHYEGASMMYGPKAGTRIGDELASLAAGLGKTVLRKNKIKYSYSTGSGKKFGVKQFDLISHQDRLKAHHYNLATVLMDPETCMPVTDNPRFVWIDDNPGWDGDHQTQPAVMPAAAIETKTESGWSPLYIDGIPENDDGTDFVTAIVASLLGKTRWTTIWMVPDQMENDPVLRAAEYRFVIRGTSGVFRSPPFTLDSARSHDGLTGVVRGPE